MYFQGIYIYISKPNLKEYELVLVCGGLHQVERVECGRCRVGRLTPSLGARGPGGAGLHELDVWRRRAGPGGARCDLWNLTNASPATRVNTPPEERATE